MLSKPIDIVVVADALSWGEVKACVAAVEATVSSPHRLLLATRDKPDTATESRLRYAGVVEIACDSAVRSRAALQNLALRTARAEFVVLLDAQTIPQQGWLEPMVRVVTEDPSVFVVGAVSVRPVSEEILQAGIHINDRLEPLYFFREEFLQFLDPKSLPTRPPAVSGICMLIRKRAIDEIGGFDEQYQNEFEDIDFCLRVRAKGYHVALSPTSVMMHREPSSLTRLDNRQENLRRLKVVIQRGESSNPKDESILTANSPLVSLLYPAYNDAAFLEQNIESIINQTYGNWELIVVNDASTDNTPEILKKYQSAYPDRIKVIDKQNHDRFDAWALCYGKSQGEYLAILGADDVLLPWCVEEQVRTLQANPLVAFVYGDVYRFDDEGRLVDRVNVAQPESEFQLVRLLAATYLFTPSILLRRSAVESAGGWLNRQFMYAQDYDLWLRLLHDREQKHVGRTVVKYRLHEAQLTVVIGRDNVFASAAAAIRDKIAKWQPEEVFPGLNLDSAEGQAAAYREIREILLSPQTARFGVELDLLKFFGEFIDRPAKDANARKAKFTLLHAIASFFRARRQYGLAVHQLWRALREGAAFEKESYRILWRKGRRLATGQNAQHVAK